MPFSAYVICATPRSGSTLLCDLLAASGVAGQPHSYLRNEDVGYWAHLWGVSGVKAVSNQEFNRSYLAAMIKEGMGQTGIFGLRLMWQSLSEATERLGSAFGGACEFAAQCSRTFGPTLFIHLSRKDKVAQAVSLVRAQQTGLWHKASDGSERERTAPPQAPIFDAARIHQAYQSLVSDDANWSSFFSHNGVQPVRLWYEDLAIGTHAILAEILAVLGRDPMIAATISPQTAKMADATSLTWMRQLKPE